MATRSSVNWESVPGNYDVLHADMSFESNNKYNIPDILPQEFIPTDLIMYGTEVRRGYASARDKCVHFFIDDYKFEPLWNKPVKTLSTIQRMKQALSPDFSIYVDDPLVMQMWNTYRSRWLGRYWQENGILVIPTVVWGDERSYDFCFEGIAKHSTVAIGTVGIRNAKAKELFIKGFEEMIRRLEPKNLIVYGEHMPLDFEKYVENIYYYDSYWKKRRKELVKSKE